MQRPAAPHPPCEGSGTARGGAVALLDVRPGGGLGDRVGEHLRRARPVGGQGGAHDRAQQVEVPGEQDRSHAQHVGGQQQHQPAVHPGELLDADRLDQCQRPAPPPQRVERAPRREHVGQEPRPARCGQDLADRGRGGVAVHHRPVDLGGHGAQDPLGEGTDLVAEPPQRCGQVGGVTVPGRQGLVGDQRPGRPQRRERPPRRQRGGHRHVAGERAPFGRVGGSRGRRVPQGGQDEGELER